MPDLEVKTIKIQRKMKKEQNLKAAETQALNIPVVWRSVFKSKKSKYWKDCPKCGLKMTYGQLVTEEGYCYSCNHRGVF